MKFDIEAKDDRVSSEVIDRAIMKLIDEYTPELIDEVKRAAKECLARTSWGAGSLLTLDFNLTIPALLVAHLVRKEKRIRPVDNFDEWGW